MNSPTKPEVAGRPVGHGKEHEEGGELGHGGSHTAVVGDLAAMNAVVHDANAEEHGAEMKPWDNIWTRAPSTPWR